MFVLVEFGIVGCIAAAIYIMRSEKESKKEVLSVFDTEPVFQMQRKEVRPTLKINIEKALETYTRLAEAVPAFNLYVGVQTQLKKILEVIKDSEGSFDKSKECRQCLMKTGLNDEIIKDLLESPLVEARSFGNKLSLIKQSIEVSSETDMLH